MLGCACALVVFSHSTVVDAVVIAIAIAACSTLLMLKSFLVCIMYPYLIHTRIYTFDVMNDEKISALLQYYTTAHSDALRRPEYIFIISGGTRRSET